LCDGPLKLADDGLRVAIRLSPGAKVDRLMAIGAAAGGARVLKACVTAPPESRRANEALLRLLSVSWHLPRRDLSIVRGLTSRTKVVRIAGHPHRLAEKISTEIAGLPGW
jgi:uncharacterized protein YggU (UPF0235/DUF167 family)